MASVRNTHLDEQLNDRVDRLLIVVGAIWELIGENSKLSDEDLIARALQIDRRDGAEDGHYRLEAVDCSCGAKVNPATHVCQFCGANAPVRTIYDLV